MLHLNEGRPIGEIISVRVIDRGVYKVFPSDLTTGVPLEYDNINFGDEDDGAGAERTHFDVSYAVNDSLTLTVSDPENADSIVVASYTLPF